MIHSDIAKTMPFLKKENLKNCIFIRNIGVEYKRSLKI